ncbi:hypothetical protein [Neisseria musculi]|uniref:hypothetical protein n=1 Tax=Neisseria musculi TaxID=1815583 RepID=UPI00164BAC68|nr:hypothetical protein [Neisseria musculi]
MPNKTLSESETFGRLAVREMMDMELPNDEPAQAKQAGGNVFGSSGMETPPCTRIVPFLSNNGPRTGGRGLSYRPI